MLGIIKFTVGTLATFKNLYCTTKYNIKQRRQKLYKIKIK